MPDFDALLERTSRTFALSIPLLPEPTRHEVTISYLLFRIADTFEDAAAWSAKQRIDALAAFERMLDGHPLEEAEAVARRWTEDPPVDHPGYLELLAETPAVIGAFRVLSEGARDSIHRHLSYTARGMAGFVERSTAAGNLRLETLEDLRDYCHVVAGAVGEMLTELFVRGRPELEPIADFLAERARYFGEGLQLTNILKDSAGDRVEGRSYVPVAVGRPRVFELAREDLTKAEEYVLALQEHDAPPGVVTFCALPVLLAWATLDRVEERGPGAKLTRPEVFALVEQMNAAIRAGQPAVRRRVVTG